MENSYPVVVTCQCLLLFVPHTKSVFIWSKFAVAAPSISSTSLPSKYQIPFTPVAPASASPIIGTLLPCPALKCHSSFLPHLRKSPNLPSSPSLPKSVYQSALLPLVPLANVTLLLCPTHQHNPSSLPCPSASTSFLCPIPSTTLLRCPSKDVSQSALLLPLPCPPVCPSAM